MNSISSFSHSITCRVLVVLLMLSDAGCSGLFFADYLRQSRPPAWKILDEKEDPLFAYEYRCRTFVLKSNTLDRGSWALIGPPLVPILPLSFFTRTNMSKFYFDLRVEPHSDSVRIAFPRIAIRVDSKQELFFPVDSFLVQRDFDRMRREGLYHWDIRTDGLDYMYRFKLEGRPDSTLDVIFLDKYLGCDIPTLHYVVNSEVKYVPLYMPRD